MGWMRLIFRVVCWFVWCCAACGFCVWLNVMLQHRELTMLQHWYYCGSHHTSIFSIPHFQNQEQLKDQDSDFLCDDSDLTLTFGDAALTANGASGGANGKRIGSTSEEALERETDCREQELLSRGTRLVFPIEDHIWVAISKFPPLLLWSDLSLWRHVSLGPLKMTGETREGTNLLRSLCPGERPKEHWQSGILSLEYTRKWLFVSFKINKWEVFPAGHWGGVLILSYVTTPQGFCNKCANRCVFVKIWCPTSASG